MENLQVSGLIHAINTALMMPPTKKVPAKWQLVKLDERHYWNEHNADSKFLLDHTEAFYGLYVFDANLHVHCCSLTPTYELHAVGLDFSLNEAGHDLDDEGRERLHDVADDGSFFDEPTIYMNVSDIERIRDKNPGHFKDVEVDVDTSETDNPTMAVIDDIREQVCTGSLSF